MSSDAFVDTDNLVIKKLGKLTNASSTATNKVIGKEALRALGETASHFDVFTNDHGATGKPKYRVVESSDGCSRICFHPNHALKLHVFQPDVSTTNELMLFDRPRKYGRCCSISRRCQQEMIIQANGTTIGYVKEPFLGGGLSPTLNVMDREDSEPVATIKADSVCCIGGLLCDHTFQIMDPKTGAVIGNIAMKYPLDLGELEMTLDKQIDPSHKASLYGALHLIDYYLFTNEGISNGCCKVCNIYCFGCVVPCSICVGIPYIPAVPP